MIKIINSYVPLGNRLDVGEIIEEFEFDIDWEDVNYIGNDLINKLKE